MPCWKSLITNFELKRDIQRQPDCLRSAQKTDPGNKESEKKYPQPEVLHNTSSTAISTRHVNWLHLRSDYGK